MRGAVLARPHAKRRGRVARPAVREEAVVGVVGLELLASVKVRVVVVGVGVSERPNAGAAAAANASASACVETTRNASATRKAVSWRAMLELLWDDGMGLKNKSRAKAYIAKGDRIERSDRKIILRRAGARGIPALFQESH